MNGFISKYSGEEIENILDKADSIEVGLDGTNNGIPFNTITVNNVVYKIPTGQQLGLYKHSISFSINVSPYGDSSNNVSLDGGDNIVSFDVFTTSEDPLTTLHVFEKARTLCFSKIVYDKRTSPKTINHTIMIGWEYYSGSAREITFLYEEDNKSILNRTITLYARDYNEIIEEVVAN